MTSEPGGGRDSVTVRREGPVATVQLANPGRRNALTWSMYQQLGDVVAALRAAETVRVVVFRGDRLDGFAAGTDISQFLDFKSAADGVAYERRIGRLLDGVATLPMPTIAGVQGAAVGAGLALAAMCDIVIAESGATFGAPIARTLGNCLSIGVVAALRNRLGTSRAMAMLLGGAVISAEELAATGFVTTVAESESFETELAAMAQRIATLAPLTLGSLKQMFHRIDAVALPDDSDLIERCYGSADFHEGVRAFLDHRRPVWAGR